MTVDGQRMSRRSFALSVCAFGMDDSKGPRWSAGAVVPAVARVYDAPSPVWLEATFDAA